MGDLGFGQIILLVVLVLVPLIRWVLHKVRLSAGNETPVDVSPVPERLQAMPKSPVPVRRVVRDESPAPQEPVLARKPSGSRFFKRTLVGSSMNVRRGILMMTILGPCRAFDPQDHRVGPL